MYLSWLCDVGSWVGDWDGVYVVDLSYLRVLMIVIMCEIDCDKVSLCIISIWIILDNKGFFKVVLKCLWNEINCFCC